MNLKLHTAIALLLMLVSLGSRSEIVVVTSAKNDVESLTREDVINIFMGRYRTFANGMPAYPLDREMDSPERHQFYLKLLNKRPEEINAYWVRLRFSGRTDPPRTLFGREAYLHELAKTPGAIGYAERSELPRELRILLSLPE
ncbi:MAG: hypothetical protein AB1340_10830 [Pseudomonadota bacterium]